MTADTVGRPAPALRTRHFYSGSSASAVCPSAASAFAQGKGAHTLPKTAETRLSPSSAAKAVIALVGPPSAVEQAATPTFLAAVPRARADGAGFPEALFLSVGASVEKGARGELFTDPERICRDSGSRGPDLCGCDALSLFLDVLYRGLHSCVVCEKC